MRRAARKCSHGVEAGFPCPDCKGGTAKPTKFGRVITTVDGIRFASKREARRYGVLRLMERAHEISRLELQPILYITVNNILVCEYVGDFRYVRDGVEVVEDCKGFRTPVYRLKKRLVKALFNIDILET